ncbi:hypothetical protein VIGAN_UM113500 [Vigna angularis var. angularis]|uniref:Uncharacterized protein n=1 Tax=Vigna angularis var. angularis TaxID=157739 RepID=A0A0S3TED6_PHAAN|nr:hypothetical protein VIGAN_UM113500 [Vigna angularis var. angularis]
MRMFLLAGSMPRASNGQTCILFVLHPVPLVQSLCCLPTRRYMCGWLESYPSRPSSGGVGGSHRPARVPYWWRKSHLLRGTRVGTVLSDAVHYINSGLATRGPKESVAYLD